MVGVHVLLARNMKQYRQKLGLSQAALAEKINCSTTFIGNIEVGKRFPSSHNLDRISDALGVTPAELFAATTDLETIARLEARQKQKKRIAERHRRKAKLEKDILRAISKAFDGDN